MTTAPLLHTRRQSVTKQRASSCPLHARWPASRVAEWRSREWWLGKCPSEAVSFGHEGTRRTRAGAGQRERRQGAPKARLLTPAPHTVLSPASFAAQDALPLKPQDRAQAEEAKRRSRARMECFRTQPIDVGVLYTHYWKFKFIHHGMKSGKSGGDTKG